jgi:ABC-type nitrate/sulfonate/bicarbonate transport system permease component
VVLAFQELIANGKLLTNTAASVGRQITGVFLAALVGIPAGLALGASPTARAAFLPLCRLLYPIPGIAWIPLAILWFGVGFHLDRVRDLLFRHLVDHVQHHDRLCRPCPGNTPT